MVTRNAVKHYKAATTPEQPSAEGKGATQTPNVNKGQSQQRERAATSPPLTPSSTPVVNRGKSTEMSK